MLYWYLSFPFVSALIGWFTNYIAVKMLFHPRLEKRILFVRVQGVFPKRQNVLSERLGRVVAKELFSTDTIKSKLDTEEVRAELKTAILKEVELYLEDVRKSNKLIAMVAGDGVMQNIKTKIGDRLDESMPKLMNQMVGRIDSLNVEQIVAERVNKFSHDRLEQLLMAVMDQEFKFITRLGGVLGFIIGVIQAVASVLMAGGI
jgi:uncharacterized membrane protein YheB (UPF0754 family)